MAKYWPRAKSAGSAFKLKLGHVLDFAAASTGLTELVIWYGEDDESSHIKCTEACHAAVRFAMKKPKLTSYLILFFGNLGISAQCSFNPAIVGSLPKFRPIFMINIHACPAIPNLIRNISSNILNRSTSSWRPVLGKPEPQPSLTLSESKYSTISNVWSPYRGIRVHNLGCNYLPNQRSETMTPQTKKLFHWICHLRFYPCIRGFLHLCFH